MRGLAGLFSMVADGPDPGIGHDHAIADGAIAEGTHMRRNKSGAAVGPEVQKTDEQWRQELSPEQYRVLRHAHTERPFTGEYVHMKDDGTYCCAGCGAELFRSGTKFESGTGWPSFYEPVVAEAVELRSDFTMLMRRTEVLCRRCGGHLGHVFNDGPRPTGQRYCINSCSLDFAPTSARPAEATSKAPTSKAPTSEVQ
jgi:peptide-methionine (R)-S-oxide reductase